MEETGKPIRRIVNGIKYGLMLADSSIAEEEACECCAFLYGKDRCKAFIIKPELLKLCCGEGNDNKFWKQLTNNKK